MIEGAVRVGAGLAEYRCPICGNEELRQGRFVRVPEEIREYRGQETRLPEYCGSIPQDRDAYAGLCRGIMVWTPTASQTDLLREDFVIDIGEGPRRVSSLSELRGIEAQSLRKAANGDGAALNFRGFSQDRSNRDRNSLAGSTYEKNRQIPIADIRRQTASGLPISVRATRPKEG